MILTQLTEDTSEQVLSIPEESPIDLRAVTFVDPYGMVSILEIGELLKSGRNKKTLNLPESEEVLKYLERMDFLNMPLNTSILSLQSRKYQEST